MRKRDILGSRCIDWEKWLSAWREMRRWKQYQWWWLHSLLWDWIWIYMLKQICWASIRSSSFYNLMYKRQHWWWRWLWSSRNTLILFLNFKRLILYLPNQRRTVFLNDRKILTNWASWKLRHVWNFIDFKWLWVLKS